jgi:hypothetical protein
MVVAMDIPTAVCSAETKASQRAGTMARLRAVHLVDTKAVQKDARWADWKVVDSAAMRAAQLVAKMVCQTVVPTEKCWAGGLVEMRDTN